jgi:hypothetical protein
VIRSHDAICQVGQGVRGSKRSTEAKSRARAKSKNKGRGGKEAKVPDQTRLKSEAPWRFHVRNRMTQKAERRTEKEKEKKEKKKERKKEKREKKKRKAKRRKENRNLGGEVSRIGMVW